MMYMFIYIFNFLSSLKFLKKNYFIFIFFCFVFEVIEVIEVIEVEEEVVFFLQLSNRHWKPMLYA